MPIAVSHISRYQFSAPTAVGFFQLRQRPRVSEGQDVLHWSLDLEGGRVEATYLDHHGNEVVLASLTPGASELAVHAHGLVAVQDRAGVHGAHDTTAPLWLFRKHTPKTAPGPALRGILSDLAESQGDIDRLHSLCAAIHARVRYDPSRTDVDTSAEQAAREGRGVCQDHAHVFCGAARELGYPARYVSGYLLLPDGIAAEASHAWAEAFVEGVGWIGFDAANAVCPDGRYVRVATGLDYGEAAPISGLVVGASGDLSVRVEVQQQQ